MKIIKSVSPFILLLIIGAITFRFLFFISYIKVQKADFRKQLLIESNNKLIEVKISNDDLFNNKTGFEWKHNNKELVINGVYHEVISIKKIKTYSIVSVIEDKAENSLFKKFFCLHKGIHKDFADLIKLLLNLTYLPNSESHQIAILSQYDIQIQEFVDQFLNHDFFLKKIKPPQFS